jgi:hypothetical protein
VKALSEAARYAMHFARDSNVRSYDPLADLVTNATVRALERRGLVKVLITDCCGRWSIYALTDAGRAEYSRWACRECMSRGIVPEPGETGFGVTCPDCHGSGFRKRGLS